MISSGRRVRRLTVLLAGSVLVAGCSGVGVRPGTYPPATNLPGYSTPSPAVPSSNGQPPTGRPRTSGRGQPSSSPTSAQNGRPVRPVPNVKPRGFTNPPTGSGRQRYQDQHLQWSPCHQQMTCATVLVPLDWSRPDGQAISLALAKRAASQTPHLGSLFVNPGGPGGSGIGLAENFNRAGLERYDIVGWDPRGAGESTPVRCDNGPALDAYYATDVSPDTPAEDAALLRANKEFGQSCLAASGALLEHISTLETVKDVELLRQLLGDRRFNFVGYSYGTEIGAVYAATYPAKVGRMVLDGAVDISNGRTVSQAQGFDRSLGDFAQWCAEARCGLGSSKAEVLTTITGLLSGLDRKPLSIGNRELTQSLGLVGIIYPLYFGQRAYPDLADAIRRALSGQGAPLLSASDRYSDRAPNGQYGPTSTSFIAISCTKPGDGVVAARRAATAAAKDAPTLGPFIGVDYSCAEWPVPPAPALPRITAPGAAPIVVVGTTGDPATPYEYAVDMTKQLSSAVLLTYQGEGHTVFGNGKSSCIDAMVVDYLADGAVPADGTRCS